MSESQLQIKCVNYCKVNNFLAFSIPNGHIFSSIDKLNFGNLTKLKSEGMLVGAPDLIVICPIHIYCIEFKTTKGRQSLPQKAFQKDIENMNSPYISYDVIRNYNSFVKLLPSPSESQLFIYKVLYAKDEETKKKILSSF